VSRGDRDLSQKPTLNGDPEREEANESCWQDSEKVYRTVCPYKALQELQRFQAARIGTKVPASVVLDITIHRCTHRLFHPVTKTP
jgi:hypothetical protein